MDTNVSMLECVTEKDYPALYKLFYARKHMSNLYTVLISMYEYGNRDTPAAYDEAGNPIYFIAARYLATHLINPDGSKAYNLHPAMVSKCQHLLCVLGFVTRVRYERLQDGKYPYAMEASLTKYRRENQYRINWYYNNECTLDVLEAAEKQAQKWVSYKLNINDVSHYTLLVVYDAQTVRQAYAGTLSADTIADNTMILSALETAIKSTIAAKGYAYAADIVQAATDATGAPYNDVQWLWTHTRKIILKKAGSKYKRPTNQDMIRFGLQSRSYIYCI